MTKKIKPSNKETIAKKRREFLNDLKSGEQRVLNDIIDGKLQDQKTKSH